MMAVNFAFMRASMPAGAPASTRAPLGYTAIESKRDLTDRERFLLLRR